MSQPTSFSAPAASRRLLASIAIGLAVGFLFGVVAQLSGDDFDFVRVSCAAALAFYFGYGRGYANGHKKGLEIRPV